MAAQRTPKRATPNAAPARPADEVIAAITATGLVGGVYRLSRLAIHAPGDYAAIATALRALAEPAFPVIDVADAVDGEQASLELRLDGVYHVLDAEVKGARVDEGVLVMLGALFEQRQSAVPAGTRRWLLIDGKTCKAEKTYLVICATLAAGSAIDAAAGTRFVKLTEV